MKTRESKKNLVAETNKTTELSQREKQCNLSLGLTNQMNSLMIDDTASCLQVVLKTTLFYPDKKEKLYQISVIE